VEYEAGVYKKRRQVFVGRLVTQEKKFVLEGYQNQPPLKRLKRLFEG